MYKENGQSVQRWDVTAKIDITYEKEQDMRINWVLLSPKGKELRIRGEEYAWEANHSEFSLDEVSEDEEEQERSAKRQKV